MATIVSSGINWEEVGESGEGKTHRTTPLFSVEGQRVFS